MGLIGRLGGVGRLGEGIAMGSSSRSTSSPPPPPLRCAASPPPRCAATPDAAAFAGSSATLVVLQCQVRSLFLTLPILRVLKDYALGSGQVWLLVRSLRHGSFRTPRRSLLISLRFPLGFSLGLPLHLRFPLRLALHLLLQRQPLLRLRISAGLQRL